MVAINETIISLIDQLTIDQLSEIQVAINNAILKVNKMPINQGVCTPITPTIPNVELSMERDVGEFVEYSPERFIDADTECLLQAELESLNFNRKARHDRVQNVFISSATGSYDWSRVKNNSKDMEKFPVIQSIMEKINSKRDCTLNSVLVSYYRTGDVCVSLHHDGEVTMNPNQPICVLSLGAERKVEFVNNCHPSYQTSLALTPESGSLYVMKEGTQQYFRHRVRKDKRIKFERFSLSFRCFLPETAVESPVELICESQTTVDCKTSEEVMSTPIRPSMSTPKYDISKDKPQDGYSPYPGHRDDTVRSSHFSTGPNPNPNEKLCLIFGSSITEGVVGERMSKGNRTVINLSSSGFGIRDVHRAVMDFTVESPDILHKVDKIIINIGTNEIKGFNCYAKNVADSFWSPLSKLVQCIKCHFDKAQIIFRSVLPIRLWYKYNAESVHLFNELLINVCKTYGCIFYDCFRMFLDEYNNDINWDLYQYSWKGNRFNLGIHLNDRGLGVLCRALKYAVNHNIHNPHPNVLPFKRFYYLT